MGTRRKRDSVETVHVDVPENMNVKVKSDTKVVADGHVAQARRLYEESSHGSQGRSSIESTEGSTVIRKVHTESPTNKRKKKNKQQKQAESSEDNKIEIIEDKSISQCIISPVPSPPQVSKESPLSPGSSILPPTPKLTSPAMIAQSIVKPREETLNMKLFSHTSLDSFDINRDYLEGDEQTKWIAMEKMIEAASQELDDIKRMNKIVDIQTEFIRLKQVSSTRSQNLKMN